MFIKLFQKHKNNYISIPSCNNKSGINIIRKSIELQSNVSANGIISLPSGMSYNKDTSCLLVNHEGKLLIPDYDYEEVSSDFIRILYNIDEGDKLDFIIIDGKNDVSSGGGNGSDWGSFDPTALQPYNEYSANETIVGKWINNKALYRIVENYTSFSVPVDSEKLIYDLRILGADDICNVDIVFTVESMPGDAFTIGSNYNYETSPNLLRAYKNGNTFSGLYVGGLSNYIYGYSNVSVVIEYTKYLDDITIEENTKFSSVPVIDGKWIDGKPIYCITLENSGKLVTRRGEFLPIIDISYLNIDTIVEYKPSIFYGNTWYYYYSNFNFRIDKNNLYIQESGIPTYDPVNKDCKARLILYYTRI